MFVRYYIKTQSKICPLISHKKVQIDIAGNLETSNFSFNDSQFILWTYFNVIRYT
jgi:hypothetical protein